MEDGRPRRTHKFWPRLSPSSCAGDIGGHFAMTACSTSMGIRSGRTGSSPSDRRRWGAVWGDEQGLARNGLDDWDGRHASVVHAYIAGVDMARACGPARGKLSGGDGLFIF